jgi:hypothetical protein
MPALGFYDLNAGTPAPTRTPALVKPFLVIEAIGPVAEYGAHGLTTNRAGFREQLA